PWLLLIETASYVLIVTRFGPKWMRNRAPFQLDRVLQFYNLANIAINCAFLAAVAYNWRLVPHIFECDDYVSVPVELRLSFAYAYTALKVSQLTSLKAIQNLYLIHC